jgi:NADH-quinone oxidoreductase subunit C
MTDIRRIRELIADHFGAEVVKEAANFHPPAVLIQPQKIKEVCRFLQNHPDIYADSLSCLTGIDNGPQANTMEVIYTLYSIPHGHHFQLQCIIDRSKPEIDTVSDVWRTADWHEREAFDLLGITFTGHPDLRRILLPTDWEGHPLRKDYEHQEKYHGITVKY